jgi:two-component system phosphate regulon response regulator PhoB
MLTARTQESDRVTGLDVGADDYVSKPFSVRELLARVRAVLRRTNRAADESAETIKRGQLAIDVARHEVTFAGQRIILTATEFRILEYLAARPGRVLSRDDIIDGALGRDTAVFNRTIDVHITALRKKLGAGGAHIETVRGFGYKWSDTPAEA